MQTVNFQCGHCGKLMGVGSEYLGQQVRCPHCQQVVIAPPPAADSPMAVQPPPAPEPSPPPELGSTIAQAPPADDDAADIFAPAEASDDLFGRSEPPRVEMPPEPSLEPTVSATFPFLPPTSVPPLSASGENTSMLPSPGGESPWLADAATETFAPPPAEAPFAPQPEPFAAVPMPAAPQLDTFAAAETPAAPRPLRRHEPKTPWFFILVFSPLLLYAIIITVFAALIYRHEQELEKEIRNPFEKMPDVGDNPGVQKGKKTTWLDNYNKKRATLPLSDQLCTTLQAADKSKPIRVGNLQITPLSVKRERVEVITEGFETRPEPRLEDSLVLRLSMKNLSSEYAFAPLDNYFDRYWRPGQDQHPPLTQLEVGDQYRFYGGPAHWYPRGSSDRREWVVGRKGFDPDLLQPGEEKEFFVCTDGDDFKGVLALFGAKGVAPMYRGQLLWRIRVRRGPVRIDDKLYSATAVVGVQFTDKDIAP